MLNDDWNDKKVLNRWSKKNLLQSRKQEESPSSIYIYTNDEQPSVAELEGIVLKCAKLIDELGIEYLGLFERAERELEKAKESLNTMEKIRVMANQSTQLNIEGNFLKP